MKACVKATGEIVEVYTSYDADFDADFVDKNGKYYWEHELFFGSLDVSSYDEPDYWTRLEHQYAGMAMQGILSNPCIADEIDKDGIVTKPLFIAEMATAYSHALVQKMKEERK